MLQEQSDESLPPKTVGATAPASNFPSFQAYSNLVENWIHQGTALSYTEQALYTANHGSTANCVAAGGTNASCTNATTRTIPANANASAATPVYLQQTWARPNLINAPGATTINAATGNATYSGAPATSFYADLEGMTTDLRNAFATAAAFGAADGSGGFAGVVPVGDASLRAVTSGVATRNMYAPDAGTDGLVDLWFNDGTHASVHGSCLSALTLFGSLTGLTRPAWVRVKLPRPIWASPRPMRCGCSVWPAISWVSRHRSPSPAPGP